MYKLLQPWHIDEEDELFEQMIIDERKRTIEGEKFIKLLDILFEHAAYFSLSIAPWTCSDDKALENELLPYLVKRTKVKKWFGYDYVDAILELGEWRFYEEEPQLIDITEYVKLRPVE